MCDELECLMPISLLLMAASMAFITVCLGITILRDKPAAEKAPQVQVEQPHG